MEFAFPWPVTQGEWLAWVSAAITVFLGAVLLFAPGISFRLFRLQPRPERPEAYAAARANMAGFYLGLGLCCVFLGPQPFLYLALGCSWLITAFGRMVSMMSDRGTGLSNWLWLVFDLVLAGLALAFALGFVP